MPKRKLNKTAFQAEAQQAAQLLKVMSNETRLMILCRLSDEEVSVGQLLAEFDLSQSALSQHLAILREQDLVVTRRDGQKIFYRIADPDALRIIETLVDIFCPQ